MATYYAPAGYAPASGDFAEFYDGDTTTPAMVYSDVGLTEELGTEATANSAGTWPAIYLDPNVLYKVKIYREGASDPIITRYPINPSQSLADGSVTAAKLASGVAVSNLGFTPVNKTGDTMTGDLIMNFTPTTADARSVGRAGAGAVNVQNSTYTFVLSDRFRSTQKTSTATPTWTIPPNSSVAFAVGDLLAIDNFGASGDVSVAPGSGVLLYASGDLTSGTKTLAVAASTVVKKIAADTWMLI